MVKIGAHFALLKLIGTARVLMLAEYQIFFSCVFSDNNWTNILFVAVNMDISIAEEIFSKDFLNGFSGSYWAFSYSNF